MKRLNKYHFNFTVEKLNNRDDSMNNWYFLAKAHEVMIQQRLLMRWSNDPHDISYEDEEINRIDDPDFIKKPFRFKQHSCKIKR